MLAVRDLRKSTQDLRGRVPLDGHVAHDDHAVTVPPAESTYFEYMLVLNKVEPRFAWSAAQQDGGRNMFRHFQLVPRPAARTQ